MDSPRRFRTRVVASRPLSSSGYELTLERDGLRFAAGRLLTIHGEKQTLDRSYTIASGENDSHLQVIYRLIPEGKLTPRLAGLQPGDELELSAPHGEFTVRDPFRPLVFVATGTGVAPCRAYIRSHADLDLTLLHGVRVQEDLFYREEFEAHRYIPCISREQTGWFHGRVTEFLGGMGLPPDAHFYLCGSNEMIFDAILLLQERGVARERIFTEAYYRGM